ncbi:MAG: hypothetical protein ACREJB_10395, partial [Planctomycetaceae bacterium]
PEPVIRLFETASGTETGVINDIGSSPRALAFSEDNRLLATSLANNNVLIWNLATAVTPPERPQE